MNQNKEEIIAKYEDVCNTLSAVMGKDECMWFIWYKMSNIVRACFKKGEHSMTGDVQGSLMQYAFVWDHNLPYWCWDFVDINENLIFEPENQSRRYYENKVKIRAFYKSLVDKYIETESGKLSSGWNDFISRKDATSLTSVISALEILKNDLIPYAYDYITGSEWMVREMSPYYKTKVKKAVKLEIEKTEKLITNLQHK